MRRKIILYGHFGAGNIGNDSSLEAALGHVKKYCPDADLLCVCSGPRDVSRRFGIQSFSRSGTHADELTSEGVMSRMKRIRVRLMDEVLFWLRYQSLFQPGDQFIVVGTGAVDDMAVRWPWHAPYELYKWCKKAKLAGAQVIFLSVGVGPIVNRISRFLMLKALKLADYRSYREVAAFKYLNAIGYNTLGDLMYPDVVFSLPKESLPAPGKLSSPPRIVGLGLINYYGWRHDPSSGERVHQEYFSKIKQFATWLFEKGYTIRILSGDTTDRWPVNDFVEFVNEAGKPEWRDRLIVDDAAEVTALLNQIAQTDLVVASRYHNVLCSLMMERPVISLGYHEKNVNLMADMGLEKYTQNIEDFTFEKLIVQFESYASELNEALQRIREKNQQYRQLLDEQYRHILFRPATAAPSTGISL